jgi:hypothetical protein
MQLSMFRKLSLNAMILNEVREKSPDELSVADKVELRQAHTGMAKYMRDYDARTRN